MPLNIDEWKNEYLRLDPPARVELIKQGGKEIKQILATDFSFVKWLCSHRTKEETMLMAVELAIQLAAQDINILKCVVGIKQATCNIRKLILKDDIVTMRRKKLSELYADLLQSLGSQAYLCYYTNDASLSKQRHIVLLRIITATEVDVARCSKEIPIVLGGNCFNAYTILEKELRDVMHQFIYTLMTNIVPKDQWSLELLLRLQYVLTT